MKQYRSDHHHQAYGLEPVPSPAVSQKGGRRRARVGTSCSERVPRKG